MLNGQKIIFVSIVDNQNRSYGKMNIRLWHHHKLVESLLEDKTCVIGKNTYNITQWKGPSSWVLTTDIKWKKSNIGSIHNIEDFRLFIDDDVYILGGNSLFEQLKDYVDEIHLYVMNNKNGTEDWIDMDLKDWKPLNYINRNIWSYAHMKRIKNYDPHSLNNELFN